jgi:hypothetical protein
MEELSTAQIASIPDREDLLRQTVESLTGQVNQINVMLNGYKHIPKYLHKTKVENSYLSCKIMDNSKGDAAKFWGLKWFFGYIFTCDDDLLYPPDYVETMITKLREYDNQVILTNHGRIMEPKPVTNAYTDRKGGIRNPDSKFHCLLDAPREEYLDIGGTGVMAWHSDYFFPDYDRIDIPNMADIWVAKFAKEQGCKILHNPHREGWIQYLHPKHTIWDDHFENPQAMTDLYNSF